MPKQTYEVKKDLSDNQPIDVAIVIPSRGLWDAKFGRCLLELGLHLQTNQKTFTIESRSSGCPGYNRFIAIYQIRQKFNPTHWLFLDDDMVFPKDLYDRLVSHDKDIVGVDYACRTGTPFNTQLTTSCKEPSEYEEGALTEVERMGFGAVLVNERVIAAVNPPWFRFDVELKPEDKGGWEGKYSEDYAFLINAHEKGYKSYIDNELSYDVGHIDNFVKRIPKPLDVKVKVHEGVATTQ